MANYSVSDAARACYLFLLKQGHAAAAINSWSHKGWQDTGVNSFEYVDEDANGEDEVLCAVEFDDDYNATVTLPSGETGEVDIKEDSEEES